MSDPTKWSALYSQTPLCDVPRHYAGISMSPFLFDYLTEVLRRSPPGGCTLETGVGSGYGAVWLSERGRQAEGLDYSPEIVERARIVSNILHGNASFYVGDLFDLYTAEAKRYDVIHHQGVLEHFTAPPSPSRRHWRLHECSTNCGCPSRASASKFSTNTHTFSLRKAVKNTEIRP